MVVPLREANNGNLYYPNLKNKGSFINKEYTKILDLLSKDSL